MTHPIKRALLSVSDKRGIAEFAQFLVSKNIEIFSTGGTVRLLREQRIEVKDVSDITGFPEIMDGRVKTLHPKVHGGILAVRDNATHQAAMNEQEIEGIDLVVINLYPFEATIAKGASWDEAIENIDIGGPAMVRASAKNHAFVTIITDPADYDVVQQEVDANGGTSDDTRKILARKAFTCTAAYDAAISGWFNRQLGEEMPETLVVKAIKKQALRYGENPHQQAGFYVCDGAGSGLATVEQKQGKELSYNNINDTDAAFALVSEFDTPAVAIIKHANPCGVAQGKTMAEAYEKALSCDPVSAYGGIIALNRRLDVAFVEALGKLFAEVIIAPNAEDDALAMLEKKKNLRVLLTGEMPSKTSAKMIKAVLGGWLYQDEDLPVVDEANLKVASKRQPDEDEMDDLWFAFTVAKHVKSNAIVLAKDGQTVGIGAGQMSRVDSVNIAKTKAERAGLETKGCAMASDAFFPFDDNVHLAAEAGVTSLIHPGGSIRDEEVIAAADQYDMAMVLTGMRHFKH
jgi:phosphoribosylaminoimidazolecarboxamide formyltransferase/IMP cyclohydrolase